MPEGWFRRGVLQLLEMTLLPSERSGRTVERLLRQQAALASFGSFAFRETDLHAILNEAARICASSLGVEHAKICQYRETHDDLLIVAGVGWHAGIVGQVVSQANKSSPQGRAYVTGEPVICGDVSTAKDFNLPAFYAEHGIVSTVDVIVKGVDGPPFGILEIDSTERHVYDEHDVNFLTGFANVLAEAVGTAARVAEKDEILSEKSMLAEELQHRVRNNLQLVSGMVSEQLRQTSDAQEQKGLRGIVGRITALAKVYDQLLGLGLSPTVDLGEYVRVLCEGLPDLQGGGTDLILLTCDVAPMRVDLETVTALGLALTELVANSYEHAFPDEKVGSIAVGGIPSARPGWGELTVSDDGIGYKVSSESKRHGIGLVRRLMEQLSGSVEVRVQEGSTWMLTFPLISEIRHQEY
jgi:two-component sensor histidine kinase